MALEWNKSISTVSRIENNQATVRMQDLPSLAFALHTTTDYLLQCIDQTHLTAADLLKQQQEENWLLLQRLEQKEQENNRLLAEVDELRKQLTLEAA